MKQEPEEREASPYEEEAEVRQEASDEDDLPLVRHLANVMFPYLIRFFAMV